MEFALTEEQLELQEMVREFVAKEITPYGKSCRYGAFERSCS